MTKYDRRKKQNLPLAQTLRDAAKADRIFEKPDPLKQYVRRFGWLAIIENYVQKLREAKLGRPWKYFTLPGKYSEDIGFLWRAGIIETNSNGKLCVAICDNRHAEKVASELQALGGVLAYSNRELSDELSSERSFLREEFPFDVINLDLCDPLMQSDNVRNLETIEWIFKLQRGQSFLLLLTTKPDSRVRQLLIDLLDQNLREEDQFKDAYVAQYGNENVNRCLADYTRFTQIVFPKVIARWARYRGYRTREHFVAKYRRYGKGGPYNMICHSFEFEPLGLRSPAKIYSPRFDVIPADAIDERLSHELPTRTQTQAAEAYVEFIQALPPRIVLDVDSHLKANRALKQELFDESQALIGWTNARV